ncbi:unnamed protein product, partial [Chrysoparadoxa australica]
MDGLLDVAMLDHTGPGVFPLRVWQNTADSGNSFLKVKLVSNGQTIHPQAIGAKVVLHGLCGGAVARQVTVGSGNMSTDDYTVSFGLGDYYNEKLSLAVTWPGSAYAVDYALNSLARGRGSMSWTNCSSPANKVVTISFEEGIVSCKHA